MSVAGFLGGAVMTTHLIRIVIDALPQDQRGEIRDKAQALGVDAPGIIPALAGA